jgi:hypothetical protein
MLYYQAYGYDAILSNAFHAVQLSAAMHTVKCCKKSSIVELCCDAVIFGVTVRVHTYAEIVEYKYLVNYNWLLCRTTVYCNTVQSYIVELCRFCISGQNFNVSNSAAE